MRHPGTGTLIGRALRLLCPRCGRSKMFTGLFHMHERCSECGLKFEREPGYFLGSIYINYGVTALISAAAWMTLRYAFHVPPMTVAVALALFCVISGTFFFRYARALWLALDCRFESDGFFEYKPPDSGARHE